MLERAMATAGCTIPNEALEWRKVDLVHLAKDGLCQGTGSRQRTEGEVDYLQHHYRKILWGSESCFSGCFWHQGRVFEPF